MSLHLAFLITAGTLREAYVAVVLGTPGMCDAAVGDCESMLIGAPIVPLDTTRTE